MSIENIFSKLLISAFWGPLAAGLILFFLQKVSSRKKKKAVTFRYVKEVVVKHVVEVKGAENKPFSVPRPINGNGGKGDDDAVPVLLVLGLLFLSIFYAKHQIEVVTVVAGFSTFILSFVLFTIFFGINKNIVHDRSWLWYLYSTSFLAILGYPLMHIAINPIYAPIEVKDMSDAILNGKLADMLRLFGLRGVMFLMLQSFGFITLSIAMLQQVLSLTFYSSVIQLAVSECPKPITNFVAKGTSKFKNPYKTIAFSLVLYVFSFILISGVGYHWWYSGSY
jgi:hypothetical protein